MVAKFFWLSRPRFWPYLLGPFVIGQVAAGEPASWLWTVILAVFFTYPANFIIYGMNDAYDYETDKLNPKKQSYEILLTPEWQRRVIQQAAFWVLVGLLLVRFAPGASSIASLGYLGFALFGVFYSMPPIRAKTIPFFDSFFNVLYVFPGVISYALTTGNWPSPWLFAAATLWCMAMHAYSAVPDIAVDTKARISTIATWLGTKNTLLFCLTCYLGAGVLSYYALGWFSVTASVVYVSVMLVTLRNTSRDKVFKLYRLFPVLNVTVGAALFFYIALIVK